MAGISPDEIDYINAHSTSTEVGDKAEINGIGAVFGNRGKDLAMSSTKSATGHLLGAAGAIEAVFSILAICASRWCRRPSTSTIPMSAAQFDLVPKVAKPKALRHVLIELVRLRRRQRVAGVFSESSSRRTSSRGEVTEGRRRRWRARPAQRGAFARRAFSLWRGFFLGAAFSAWRHRHERAQA